MITQPSARIPIQNQSQASIFGKIMAGLLSGLIVSFTAGVMVIIGFEIIYAGKIYPGVYAAGVDLTGVKRSEAAGYLANYLTYGNSGLAVFQFDDQIWAYSPEELGFLINYEDTTKAAYKTGRSGWPWERLLEQYSTLQQGTHVPVQLYFDARVAQDRLEKIGKQINLQTVEAKLSINGFDVTVEPGQIGRVVDVPKMIGVLENNLLTMQDFSIQIEVVEYPPVILDVTEQANLAKEILSRSLTLKIDGPVGDNLGPWVFDRETIASMLTISLVVDETGARYQVGLDTNKLRGFLTPLAPSLILEPANARFIFNDDTRELEVIQNAVIGRELMVEETINYINLELSNGSHSIALVFDYTNPDVTDDKTGEELGITELVSSQTTYFYGSSSGRIQNIQIGAAQFHGILIPPGATFSMVENIGDISLDSGYAEAWIIYGNRTIKGVGGGICQVSTTLYRTMFFGGYPVEERYSHAYRVLYYEQGASGAANSAFAGLDATVYTPVVDFKFTNDTPYWLLMETYVNTANRSLTWKFYSTSDGRTVDWTTSGLTNVKDPPDPVFEEDPDLRKGAINQVDWAVKGATVTITRTVTRDGEVLHYDEYTTVYRPWASVCKYGPGTKSYPPEEGVKLDKYSCKANQK